MENIFGESNQVAYIEIKEFYENFIKELYQKYDAYSKQWLKENEYLNLKKHQIRNIYNCEDGLDSKFSVLLKSFRDTLDDLCFDFLEFENFNINENLKLKFGVRVKSMESIYNKIDKNSKIDGGRFPVKKCLNDLLGCRIIDSNYEYNINIIKEVIDKLNNEENDYKIKYMDRLNNGYKAFHVYFEINNNIFSMEIQFWNQKDEANNIGLHKEYKQGYILEYIEK